MQRAKRLAVMLAVVLIALAGVLQVWAQGNVIHVSATAGTDGPGCGAGAAPPCRSIKFAVENRAQTGDRILVAAGTYTEPFSVLTSGVQILATGPAGINGQDTRGPMIAAGAGITAATVISGFTITGGVTTTTAAAGGVYLTGDASPVLHGNTICANGGFQLARGGAGVVDAAGNWWGTNTPRAGVTYTGTVQAAPPISVSLQLRQPLTGTGSLGSLGSGSLVVGRVAQITVTMKGGGYTPPPGTAITLKGTHGAFSGGVTATSLLIANGVATTLFTPTASRATVISAFHACNPSQAVATLDFRFHVYLPLTLRGYPAPPPPPPPEPEPTC
ncbi:MAG: hypothetical protein ACE5G8_16735, partial [Anaerolineae bacterium]